jgi:hypothetical protein
MSVFGWNLTTVLMNEEASDCLVQDAGYPLKSFVPYVTSLVCAIQLHGPFPLHEPGTLSLVCKRSVCYKLCSATYLGLLAYAVVIP